MPPTHTFTTEVAPDPGGTTMCAFELDFDPKAVFGKVRAPVVVAVGRHRYRSTICKMSGNCFVPLRLSNREAAGVQPGQRVSVTLTLDDQPRLVKPPRELAAALKGAGLAEAWKAMSFTHQREHAEAIEQAKRPETREKRIAACVEALRARAKIAARRSKSAQVQASKAKKASAKRAGR